MVRKRFFFIVKKKKNKNPPRIIKSNAQKRLGKTKKRKKQKQKLPNKTKEAFCPQTKDERKKNN